MKKHEVPQINPINGVSLDYINAFYGIMLSFENNFLDLAIKELFSEKEFIGLLKYEERFNSEEYDTTNLINDKNRKNIEELNKIVDNINNDLKKYFEIDGPKNLKLKLRELTSQFSYAAKLIQEIKLE